MRQYVFFTDEGYTFQPGSEAIEPDVENLQILGFARGRNANDAFHALLRENDWLYETSFQQVISMPLAGGWEASEWFLIPGDRLNSASGQFVASEIDAIADMLEE